jgi:ligand-binding SRPBCC domain-containing protein
VMRDESPHHRASIRAGERCGIREIVATIPGDLTQVLDVMAVVPHVLVREQWFPRPIEDVFAFFADARNLEVITPAWLGFRILSPQPIVMRSGTRIRYRLRWHGLPVRWLTEIESWNPPTKFADVQLRGPYRLWHHSHRFESIEGGTLMCDEVRYAIPFALPGQLACARLVRSELEAIFDYRSVTISNILGARSAPG